MPTVNYRAQEKDILVEKALIASVTYLIKQLNVLRAVAGLPPLTKQDVLAGIKEEYKKL